MLQAADERITVVAQSRQHEIAVADRSGAVVGRASGFADREPRRALEPGVRWLWDRSRKNHFDQQLCRTAFKV